MANFLKRGVTESSGVLPDITSLSGKSRVQLYESITHGSNQKEEEVDQSILQGIHRYPHSTPFL